MRRLRVIIPAAIFYASLPLAAARAESSLWVGRELHARLDRTGNSYVLTSQPSGIAQFLSAPAVGTVLLRATRFGDSLEGTAYVFANGCAFGYPVRGRLFDDDTRIVWSGQQPSVAQGCRIIATRYETTSIALVSPRPRPPSPIFTPPPPRAPMPAAEPWDWSPPHLPFGADQVARVMAILAGGIISTFLFVFGLRLAFLRRLRGNRLLPRPLSASRRIYAPPTRSSSTFTSSLPSSSGKIFGSRTELLKADAEFVASHTEWLRQRVQQAETAGDLVDARLRLVEKLASLATVPALLNSNNPNATSASFSLTLAEIEQMIAGMPEVSSDLRGALLRLLQARLKEKLE
jgi:hypothetical protein